MKKAEDDGEIVIKSMFFHLMTGKRCKLRATSHSDAGSRKNNSSMCPFRTSWAPSPRTMMVSVEVGEIFPQERMRADLRTQILEGS